MGLERTDEFRQDAVRIALTSGLTRKQIAMIPCLTGYCAAMSREGGCWHVGAEQKDHSAPRHGRSFKGGFRPRQSEWPTSAGEPAPEGGEGDLKKGHPVLRGPKAMRFRFVHFPAVH